MTTTTTATSIKSRSNNVGPCSLLLLLICFSLLWMVMQRTSIVERPLAAQSRLRQPHATPHTLDDIAIGSESRETKPSRQSDTYNETRNNQSILSGKTPQRAYVAIRGITFPPDGQSDGVFYPVRQSSSLPQSGMLDEDEDFVDYIEESNQAQRTAKTSNLRWYGNTCAEGSLLDHPDLTGACGRTESAFLAQNGSIDEQNGKMYRFKELPRRICFAIENAHSGRSKVPCGHWQTGWFSGASTPPSRDTPLSHEKLRKRLSSLRSKKASDRTTCSQASFYSSLLTPSRFDIIRQEEPDPLCPLTYPFALRSRECPDTYGALGNQDTLAVLYKHAYQIEDPSAAPNENNATHAVPTTPRGIVFSGDSMTRNIFHTLVAHIRGQPTSVEHYYHTDALYVIYPSSDLLVRLHSSTRRQYCGILRTFFPGYHALPSKCSWKTNLNDAKEWPLIAILFIWDVSPVKHRADLIAMRNVALQVGGYAYWWYATSNTSLEGGEIGVKNAKMNVQIDPYLEDIQKVLSFSNTERKFIWMTTPLLSKDFDLAQVLGPLGERNAKMARWVREGTRFSAPLAESQVRNAKEEPVPASVKEIHFLNISERRYLFDLAGAVDVLQVANVSTRDGMHFSCSWSPQSPGHIQRIKSNAFHCRDPLNANALQWLLHLSLFI